MSVIKSLVKSFFSAFLMYSRIPVPQVEWKKENRRYSLCFFPLVGVVIGGLFVLWFIFCKRFNVDNILFSAISVAIPVFVTGGIHIDGFCDVHDAKACMGDKNKLFEVMSDSRVGAFSVINLSIYFIIQFGLFSQIKSFDIMIISALGFVLSRALSGLAVVTFKSAKSESTLNSFNQNYHKNIIVITEIFYIFAVSVLMIYVNRLSGLFAVFGGFSAMIYYRIFSYRRFGGITGDLAGYFLQICELSITGFAVFSDIISEVLL